MKRIAPLLALLALSPLLHAQALSPVAQSAVLDKLGKRLVEAYVFEDIAKQMVKRLGTKLKAGGYSGTDAKAFAAAIQKDLSEVSGDIHLAVFHDPALYADLTTDKVRDPAAEAAAKERGSQQERSSNFGFERLEILPGNVAYLEITSMSGLVGTEAGPVAAGAMAMMASADAIIIDLRRNPGGDGRMNQFLSSYFFEADDEQWLVSNHNRSAGTTRQEWTQPFVPGKRMPKTPVYVLVGAGTGSAAEGFAYNLQALKRVTVVGEKTAGGAHSGSYLPLGDGIVAFIPVGRVINPITKGNWEKVGVEPDVPIPSTRALAKAHLLALEKMKSGDALMQAEIEWQLPGLRAKVDPPKLEEAALRSLAGDYKDDEGSVRVLFEGGYLWYLIGTSRFRLVPLTQDLFLVEGSERYGKETYRLRFNRPSGLTALIHYAKGRTASFEYKRA